MPDDLKTVVQRMIDAGEPEENIATVIQHFKAQAPAAPASNGVLQMASDLGAGALKGAAHTALDLGGLVQSIPGVGSVTNALGNAAGGAAGRLLYGTEANPVSNDAAQADARDRTAYANTTQRIGGGLETAAEMAVPVGDAVNAIPRAGRAAKTFEGVMQAAKDVPVDMSAPGDAMLRIAQLGERGGTTPRAVTQLLRRTTDPTQPALTYGEGRDFASNISRLSGDEYNRLTPVIRREMGTLRESLNGALGDAASTVGKGEDYANAMKEYAQAMQLKAAGSAIGQGALKAAPYASAGGLGYLMAKKLADLLAGGGS